MNAARTRVDTAPTPPEPLPIVRNTPRIPRRSGPIPRRYPCRSSEIPRRSGRTRADPSRYRANSHRYLLLLCYCQYCHQYITILITIFAACSACSASAIDRPLNSAKPIARAGRVRTGLAPSRLPCAALPRSPTPSSFSSRQAEPPLASSPPAWLARSASTIAAGGPPALAGA